MESKFLVRCGTNKRPNKWIYGLGDKQAFVNDVPLPTVTESLPLYDFAWSKMEGSLDTWAKAPMFRDQSTLAELWSEQESLKASAIWAVEAWE